MVYNRVNIRSKRDHLISPAPDCQITITALRPFLDTMMPNQYCRGSWILPIEKIRYVWLKFSMMGCRLFSSEGLFSFRKRKKSYTKGTPLDIEWLHVFCCNSAGFWGIPCVHTTHIYTQDGELCWYPNYHYTFFGDCGEEKGRQQTSELVFWYWLGG